MEGRDVPLDQIQLKMATVSIEGIINWSLFWLEAKKSLIRFSERLGRTIRCEKKLVNLSNAETKKSLKNTLSQDEIFDFFFTIQTTAVRQKYLNVLVPP